MGKKTGPAPPPAPDPIATAQAQTASNKETAIANANLNRVNQYTPYGSSEWSTTGNNPDGTPIYQNEVKLSPAQQALLDSQNTRDLSLNNFANDQISRVNNTMRQPFDFSGAPASVTGVDRNAIPRFAMTPDAPTGLKSTFDTGGNVQSQVKDVNWLSGFDGGGPITNSFGGAGPIQRNVATTGSQMTNSIGNAGSQQRTMNGQVPNLYDGNVQSSLDLNGLPGMPGVDDWGAERQKVEDAMYGRATSRLDPRFAQDQRAMEDRLVNMGIARGSEAWNREVDNFGRTKNDAYSTATQDAILAGGQEQSRIFNDALNARMQGYNERLGAGQFANNADMQRYNYAMGNRQQTFNENMGAADLYNRGQSEDFAQQALRAQFGNSVARDQFDQNLAAAGFANTAQAQEYAQQEGRATFANTAQAQQFGQNQTRANFAQDALKAQFDANMRRGEFANEAQAQRYNQNLGATSFANEALQTDFGNRMAAAAQQNTMRAQGFQELQTNAAMQNDARARYIQEQSYLRNLPIQDIAALLGNTNGVQQPQFGAVPGVNQANTDTMGAVYNSYNGQMNAWNAQQQARANTMGAIFGALGTAGGMAAMSDRRMKENIKRIGHTVRGIPTYTFNYIGDKVRRFGVMAQEVMHIPGAVITNDGVMYVNYGKVW